MNEQEGEEVMPNIENTPKSTRPVQEIRLGRVKAAIWANRTREGVIFNVTFERSYKDGETWKTSTSFGRDDLLKVAKLADQAHSWMTQSGATAHLSPDFGQGKLPKKPSSTPVTTGRRSD
jgi:hypothetical protein